MDLVTASFTIRYSRSSDKTQFCLMIDCNWSRNLHATKSTGLYFSICKYSQEVCVTPSAVMHDRTSRHGITILVFTLSQNQHFPNETLKVETDSLFLAMKLEVKCTKETVIGSERRCCAFSRRARRSRSLVLTKHP